MLQCNMLADSPFPALVLRKDALIFCSRLPRRATASADRFAWDGSPRDLEGPPCLGAQKRRPQPPIMPPARRPLRAMPHLADRLQLRHRNRKLAFCLRDFLARSLVLHGFLGGLF